MQSLIQSFKQTTKALPGLLLFFAFLVLGAVIHGLFIKSLPAVIVGMFAFLLFLWLTLLVNKRVPTWIKTASDMLLPLLPLFILPSCIGILGHYELLKGDFIILFVSLFVGIVLTQMITPLVFRFALKVFPEKRS